MRERVGEERGRGREGRDKKWMKLQLTWVGDVEGGWEICRDGMGKTEEG